MFVDSLPSSDRIECIVLLSAGNEIQMLFNQSLFLWHGAVQLYSHSLVVRGAVCRLLPCDDALMASSCRSILNNVQLMQRALSPQFICGFFVRCFHL